jgi:hypothetical protein
MVDADLNAKWILLSNGRKLKIEEGTECREPANLFGLQLLMEYGLTLAADSFSFSSLHRRFCECR